MPARVRDPCLAGWRIVPQRSQIPTLTRCAVVLGTSKAVTIFEDRAVAWCMPLGQTACAGHRTPCVHHVGRHDARHINRDNDLNAIDDSLPGYPTVVLLQERSQPGACGSADYDAEASTPDGTEAMALLQTDFECM